MKKKYLTPRLRSIIIEQLMTTGSINSSDSNPVIDNLEFYDEEITNHDELL